MMKAKIEPLVKITDFENLSVFLKEFYRTKKEREPTFSYEKWNRSLGGRNRSYLQLLVSGKRKVNNEYRDRFLQYFQFNKVERQHFLELSQMDVTRSDVSKQQLKKRVGNRQRIDKARVFKAQEAFFTNLKIPVLYALTTFTDFHATLESLAKRIQESESNTLSWLGVLENLNLVKFDQTSKSWKADDNVLAIPLDTAGHLSKFLRASLMAAAMGMDSSPTNLTPFSYQVWLEDDEIETFNSRAKAFADQLAIEYMPGDLGNRKAYQWTLVVSPILK